MKYPRFTKPGSIRWFPNRPPEGFSRLLLTWKAAPDRNACPTFEADIVYESHLGIIALATMRDAGTWPGGWVHLYELECPLYGVKRIGLRLRMPAASAAVAEVEIEAG